MFHTAALENLQKINDYSFPTDHLRVGDFNGDGKADIFISLGSIWSVVYEGKGNLTPLNVPSILFGSHGISKIKVGDFDGDGKSDILYTY